MPRDKAPLVSHPVYRLGVGHAAGQEGVRKLAVPAGVTVYGDDHVRARFRRPGELAGEKVLDEPIVGKVDAVDVHPLATEARIVCGEEPEPVPHHRPSEAAADVYSEN